MVLLKATERFWCRACSSPNASFWLKHKHYNGSFLVGFCLFLKFPGGREHWCYRKWFSIFSIARPPFLSCVTRERRYPHTAGWLSKISHFAVGWTAGEQEKSRLSAGQESHPLMFPSCLVPDKRSFPIQTLRNFWFFATWDAPASPCGVHVCIGGQQSL